MSTHPRDERIVEAMNARDRAAVFLGTSDLQALRGNELSVVESMDAGLASETLAEFHVLFAKIKAASERNLRILDNAERGGLSGAGPIKWFPADTVEEGGK